MKSIRVLEKVKLSHGKIDIFCNYYSKKLESGVNAGVCLHVALMYMVEGMASPKPKERLLLTGGQKRQGNLGTSRKQLIKLYMSQ